MSTLQDFLDRNQLPQSFEAYATQWFEPLINAICKQLAEKQASAQTQKQPLLLGISGCQGSGKSTLADYLAFKLESDKHLAVANCSLDDFYLKKSERQQLALEVHPLLQTRGVPGTHDTQLAMDCFRDLKEPGNRAVDLPIFDKLADDRSAQCNSVQPPVDVIIFEGWCLGAEAQTDKDLQAPTNKLEEQFDEDTSWRSFVNQKLKHEYQALFSQIDFLIMLKAPSFNCVLNWRTEQEEKLAEKELSNPVSNKKAMTRKEIEHFIQHYQRITEQLLISLPSKADIVFELNDQRRIQSLVNNQE